jgi:hypothetical protein
MTKDEAYAELLAAAKDYKRIREMGTLSYCEQPLSLGVVMQRLDLAITTAESASLSRSEEAILEWYQSYKQYILGRSGEQRVYVAKRTILDIGAELDRQEKENNI